MMRMFARKHRILPVAALLMAAATFPLAAYQDSEAQPKIVTHMKAVNGGLRGLRRSYADPAQKESNLSRLDEVRGHAEAARELQPLKTPEIPEAEREAFLKGFHEAMDQLLKGIDDLKAAIAADKFEEAGNILRGIYDLRSEAHKKYQKEVDG